MKDIKESFLKIQRMFSTFCQHKSLTDETPLGKYPIPILELGKLRFRQDGLNEVVSLPEIHWDSHEMKNLLRWHLRFFFLSL